MLESAGRRPRAARTHHLRVHTACEHSLRAQRARTACVHSVQSRMHSDAMRRWRAALVHTKRQLTRNKHVQPSGLDRRRQPLLPLPPCPPARPTPPPTIAKDSAASPSNCLGGMSSADPTASMNWSAGGWGRRAVDLHSLQHQRGTGEALPPWMGL